MYQPNLKIRIPKDKDSFFSVSLILSIANFVISILCIFKVFDVDSNIRAVVILPLLYTLLFCLIRRKMHFINPGMLTLNIVAFMRYSVTPIVIITTNELNFISLENTFLNKAIIIMAFEMVAIFATILLYNPVSRVSYDLEIKNSSIIKFLAIATAILLLIDNRSLIGNLSISTGTVGLSSNGLQTTSGIITIIWQANCVFIFCFVIRGIYESKFGKKIVLLSLACCLAYLFVIYTGQATISRWYSVVTLIASSCWLIKLYPNKKITIILYVAIPACVVLTIATILKNTSVGMNAEASLLIKSIFNSTNMDTYFAGPVNVNTAIAVKQSTGVGIHSLFYDMLNNFPYLNHVIERSNASVNIFNDYLGRHDQILPLVGQSFIWFGYMFSPLLSILSVIFVKRADEKFESSNSIITYLYAFIAVWCALMLILNFTIWLSWMYSRIIPAIILFKVVTRKKYRQCNDVIV